MKTDKYTVIELCMFYPLAPNRTWEFSKAKDVVLHMWGRDGGKHLIYKNGILAQLCYLHADLKELEEYLEGL